MTQETLNLIIVGAIGFVPSLLILVLSDYFQKGVMKETENGD